MTNAARTHLARGLILAAALAIGIPAAAEETEPVNQHGADLTVREITAGLFKAKPGEAGSNSVRRADGRSEPLQGCDETEVSAGDAIVIVTPTGGGYGRS